MQAVITFGQSGRSSHNVIAAHALGDKRRAIGLAAAMGEASTAGRKGYHHGRLREAMIEAAVALIEEVGPYAVTVREVARRAGVSPGAPFRHFPTRMALLTAVAEEAMRRFQAEIAAALGPVGGADVRTRMTTVARTYLTW